MNIALSSVQKVYGDLYLDCREGCQLAHAVAS